MKKKDTNFQISARTFSKVAKECRCAIQTQVPLDLKIPMLKEELESLCPGPRDKSELCGPACEGSKTCINYALMQSTLCVLYRVTEHELAWNQNLTKKKIFFKKGYILILLGFHFYKVFTENK